MTVLVGKKFPNFVASAVMPDNTINETFNFEKHINNSLAVLFFWPADFTFVCPSEIIAFNNRLKEFEAKGVKVVGCSIDSQFVHLAWKNTPVEQGGIGNIQFPMVADIGGQIAKDYDVLCPANLAFRGTFLIGKNGVVAHQVINDLPIGRDIDELLRVIDAKTFTDEHGEVCPANWRKGQKAMKPTAEGVAEYLKENAENI